MSKAEILRELADRVKKSNHQDRSLNHEIGTVMGEQFNHAFTSSLDSAMRLVPEGCRVSLYAGEHGSCQISSSGTGTPVGPYTVRAATPALALCAAALFAQAERAVE